jgi:hypothetical protein
MGFGDVAGLLLAMGGLLGIIGMFAAAYHRRLSHKERMAELRAGSAQPGQSDPQTAVIEKLEHRLRVLERIATDKSANLAIQIEDLREGADAR